MWRMGDRSTRKGIAMHFLRMEKLSEYARLYPVGASFCALMIAVHVGFFVWAFVTQSDVDVLKRTFGAFYTDPMMGIQPTYWDYFTSAFLHADWMHLLFNVFFLYVFSPPLERLLSSWLFAGLLLVSGFIGNVFTFLYYDAVSSIGASGMVYGLYGAYVLLMWRIPSFLGVAERRMVWALLIIGFGFSLLFSNVNMSAHVGGFVGGFVYALVARYVLPRREGVDGA
jgi:membrane associated rhomboid family serine protease